MLEPKAKSYFASFKRRKFEYNEQASLEGEFDRLARHMKWTPGSKVYQFQLKKMKRLTSVNSYYSKLNTLIAYAPLYNAEFDYKPDATFEDGFTRLSKVAALNVESDEYERHRTNAKVLEYKFHRTRDQSSLDFFKTYLARDKFKLDSEARIDVQFQLLAKHLKWEPDAFVAHWRELLAEVHGPTATAMPNGSGSCSTNEAIGAQSNGTELTLENALADLAIIEVERPPPGISNYFWSFIDVEFWPNAEHSFQHEFQRLCSHLGWLPTAKKDADDLNGNNTLHSDESLDDDEGLNDFRRLQLSLAMESELELHFGLATRLKSWQTLCAEVDIVSKPSSIELCKEALRRVFVHITLLVESRRVALRDPKLATNVPFTRYEDVRTSAAVHADISHKAKGFMFGSLKELSEFCHKHRLYFPLEHAKEYGFLEVLLRLVRTYPPRSETPED